MCFSRETGQNHVVSQKESYVQIKNCIGITQIPIIREYSKRVGQIEDK